VLRHERRQVVHFNITEHPTGQWTAQQMLEVLNERYLTRLLRSYFSYYHAARTHLALDKQSPEPRQVESPDRGKVVAFPHIGGLHHEYRRAA
jgi:hypothetical protein